MCKLCKCTFCKSGLIFLLYFNCSLINFSWLAIQNILLHTYIGSIQAKSSSSMTMDTSTSIVPLIVTSTTIITNTSLTSPITFVNSTTTTSMISITTSTTTSATISAATSSLDVTTNIHNIILCKLCCC